ncbi:glycosyltransferase family 2 protein [Faecalicatena faecalis]|nr:glycosyltransferase family 2 protein [Faecalicatena faecalis]
MLTITRGLYKIMECKISVITVCRNAGNTIRETIESVFQQNYVNYEYIIIDGLSSDNTLQIAQSYREQFASQNIMYKIISEEDNGIFDAMNKAADLAMGEWIIYMNADDSFINNHVLSDISKYLYEQYDVVYGNTMRIKGKEKFLAEASPINKITKAMPFTHQSCLTKTMLIREYRFDLNYEVADYNLFLHLWLDGYQFLQTDVTIANYSVEGYSNQNKYKTYKSTLHIKHDFGLLNKDSLIQKIKNIYFRMLLDENILGHRVAKIIWQKYHNS